MSLHKVRDGAQATDVINSRMIVIVAIIIVIIIIVVVINTTTCTQYSPVAAACHVTRDERKSADVEG